MAVVTWKVTSAQICNLPQRAPSGEDPVIPSNMMVARRFPLFLSNSLIIRVPFSLLFGFKDGNPKKAKGYYYYYYYSGT